ncbi:MAG: ATP-binding region, ATPase domain protein [Nocardioides sp.]|jgi:two-component system OmpR family sensor kinase|nr:ATP-binding region, ATPase domain protein [Nocardioides sp.]
MNRFASLTARLVVTTLALVAVISLLAGTATTLAVRSYLTGQLDSDVHATLERAQNAPSFPRDLGTHPASAGPGDLDDRRGQGVGTLTAQWFTDYPTPIGEVITEGDHGSAPLRKLSSAALALIDELPTDGSVHQVRLPGFGSYRVAVTGTSDSKVAAGLPTDDVDAVVSQLIGWELLLIVLGGLLAGGLGLLLVRRQLRPLHEVAETAHAVSALPLSTGEIDLSERVPEHLTDEHTEVGQVGAALNTLLAHVETSLSARHRSELQVRQFVADASHELRSPLATIVGYTELARRRPGDAATLATALDKVEEESGRMTALVEDLLLLARLDSGRPLDRQPVDLTRLLLEAVSDARVLAPDHLWRLELPDDVVEVTGDEQRLHQVVTNLLTNARKYTPAGTTVTVRATAGGFEVHDDGPGFAPDVAEHAFERFARGDTSRTRGADSGAGLGLALVQAIVTAHGGSVTLATEPGDTTLAVTLAPDLTAT